MDSNNLIKSFSLSTLNLFGAKSCDSDVLYKTFESIDIMMFQETWLYESESNFWCEIFPNHNSFSKSGFDNSAPLRGRPHGGVSICVKQSLQCEVVECDSRRILPVLINDVNGLEVLVICVYMPVNRCDISSLSLFTDCLNSLSTVLDQYPNTPIILGGDFNLSPNLPESRSKVFCQFISDYNLEINLISKYSELQHSYIKQIGDTTHKSTVDWFIFSKNYNFNQTKSRICLCPEVNSDHNPIVCSISIPQQPNVSSCLNVVNDAKNIPPVKNVHFLLDKLTNENWNSFMLETEAKLQMVNIPLTSINCSKSCNEKVHSVQLQNYCHDILEVLRSVMLESNPEAVLLRSKYNTQNNGSKLKKKPIPGWQTHVRPKQSVMFKKLAEWKKSRDTIDSVLYKEYSHARKEYHCAIRYVKNNEKNLRSEAIARSLSNSSSSKEFWKKLKRSFPSKSKPPTNVEGLPYSDPILADKFSDAFKKDFNNYDPSRDKEELHSLLDFCPNEAKTDCWGQNNVVIAINMLAHNKCTSDNLPPELYSHASLSLAIHLSLLFRACEQHCFCSSCSSGRDYPSCSKG